MKKVLSLLLSVVMIAGLMTAFAAGTSAADLLTAPMVTAPAVTAAPGINYDAAKDGDVLYEVNFGGDAYYAPFNFRNGNAKMAATTATVSDGGKTITCVTPADAGAAWFYGGPIKGLTLGEGKKYTVTFQAAFPSGNAGVYFNFGYRTADDGIAATSDTSYNGLYGLYGKLTGTSLTMSRGAGGKITGDKVSLSSGYTVSPVDVANGTMANIRYEIDGYFYSVFINDVFYDQVYMYDLSKCTFAPCPNIGFTIYLYNKNATFTVKDVVIKKGCSHTMAANSSYTAPALTGDKADYNAFKEGDKIMDLLFNAKSGAYVPTEVQKNDTNTMTISADGKSYKSVIGGTKGAEWYGGAVKGLKVADGSKYTFKYKVKTEGTTYAGCVAYNVCAGSLSSGYRLNWYGAITNPVSETVNGEKKDVLSMKYAYNGTNFPGYGYADSNMEVFHTFTPKLDADGFADVAVELDGWTWTYWCMGTDGKYQKLQTVDNAALRRSVLGLDKDIADDLGFEIYTYNTNVSMEVKNAELYKGTVISGVSTPADPGTPATPDNPVTPVNPTTGDRMLAVVVLGIAALCGVSLVSRKRLFNK